MDHYWWTFNRTIGRLAHYVFGQDCWNQRNRLERALRKQNPETEASDGHLLLTLLLGHLSLVRYRTNPYAG